MEPPKNKEQMLLLVQMEKRCLDMTECGWGRMSMTWVGPYKIIFIFSQIPLNFFPNSVFFRFNFCEFRFFRFNFVNPDLLLLYYQKQCVFM